jgi:hypothetical protein
MLGPYPSAEASREAPSANEDGVYLDDLQEGAVVELETAHHHYRIEKCDHAKAVISGHPTFCPEPITVQIEGSTRSGLPSKPGFIGRGMHLIFEHPVFHSVATSRIREIHVVS